MAKMTTKNTKNEILEAYESVLNQLAEAKAGKTTTAEVVKAKEIKATKEAAKEIVGLNILNDEMTKKYESLISTIEMLEKDIEELYGIKAEADSLEALINAHKDKEKELDAKHNERLAKLNAQYEEKAEANKREDERIKADLKKLLEEARAKYNEETAKLNKDRAREKEEYTYNLKRERAIENDKWADEKATREKELADKELEIAKREVAASTALSNQAQLEAEIESLKAETKAQYAQGVKDGEAQAEKVTAIKIAKANQECEFKVNVAESKVESLTAANAKLEAQNAELQAKLDAASTRVQEMAIKVAENSGARIIETSTK